MRSKARYPITGTTNKNTRLYVSCFCLYKKVVGVEPLGATVIQTCLWHVCSERASGYAAKREVCEAKRATLYPTVILFIKHKISVAIVVEI